MKSLLCILFSCLFLFYTQSYAYQYAILVDKSSHVLNVYSWDENNDRELVASYAAITGKNSGNKKTQGDLKTPEGIYFVTELKTEEQMKRAYGSYSKKYGPIAFVLNYPNIYDQNRNKTGSGIWIHGVDSKQRILKPFDTEGCVALANSDVLDLKQYITVLQTPIVIVDSMESVDIDKIFSDGSAKHKKWIENWRTSWENGNLEEYAKHYSDSFQSVHKNKDSWLAYKKKLIEITDKNVSIEIKNPKIVEFKDQLVLTFEQKYSSPLKQDEGKKSLYLQKNDQSYAILAEEFHSLFNWK